MFFPLFLLAIVILSIVSVSAFTMIDQHQNTANLMASAATFYAAESSLEESKYQFKLNKEAEEFKHNPLIRAFHKEQEDISQSTGKLISEDYEIDIIERSFNEAPTRLATVTNPQSFDEFRFIDISQKNHFTELEFYFQKKDEIFNSGVLIDIIAFPRTYFDSSSSAKINFGSVRKLSTKTGDIDRNVKRMMYSSLRDEIFNDFDNITVTKTGVNQEYQQLLKIKNLAPAEQNYIIRFQTLNREKIHYALKAVYGGEDISLELTNQILEVDSQTSTMNMFQRVKEQQRSFAPLQPGLDFVLFSDKTISK